ncbi:DNRLRE domain-containing protein [Sulfidibacter corallicola]|uniref:DNRLRE domain-containing protein n=1 Tax=Sulfidibacter corallicola TaxID=2818388 RepID=A0A8A4TL40_SULCO|nr:DNRLRE domain-containing protein [Sulfidibacter corallicola]QTD50293.1 DNRLRE domain-containing protein [Sulfidibacter corallicola]
MRFQELGIRWQRMFCALTAVLALCSGPPAWTQCNPVELTPLDDSFVCFDPTAADLNHGSEPTINVWNDGTGRQCQTLLKFDIGNIPENPCSVLLKLTGAGTGSFEDKIEFLRITLLDPNDAWSESTVRWGQPNPKPDTVGKTLSQRIYFETNLAVAEYFDITELYTFAIAQGHTTLGLELRFLDNPFADNVAIWSSKEGTHPPETVVNAPIVAISEGPANTTGEIPYLGRGRAAQFTLANSDNSAESVAFQSVEISFSGEGREGTAVQTARLYRDNNGDGSVDGGDLLLDNQALTSDDPTVTFDLSGVTLAIGQTTEILLDLESTDQACPNELFVARVNSTSATGQSTGAAAVELFDRTPAGAGRISVGNLDIVSGDQQSNETDMPWDEPLVVQVSGRNLTPGACPADFVTWNVFQAPPNGDLELEETETTIATDGRSEGVLKPASVAGEYRISAAIGGPFTDFDIELFTVFVAGLEVSAQHDGAPEDFLFGTFIPGIEAPNQFTASATTDGQSTVDRVDFTLDGNTQMGTPSGDNWVTTFDMGDLAQGLSTLQVEAKDGGGAVILNKNFDMEALAIPQWFALPGLSKEWSAAEETYSLDVNLPADPTNPFDWTGFEIPEVVELLAGTENDGGGGFAVNVDFKIDRNVTVEAQGGFDITVFGNPASFDASLALDFDDQLTFQGGNGEVTASIDFELPEKGASRTVIIYGVPLTLAVDLGGTVTVSINGNVVFSDTLEIETARATPGITITVDLTLSASLFFGVAKLAFAAHPTADVSMTIEWNQAGGTSGLFQGSFTIPYEVIGSLFWGALSGTLAEGEFGPWEFSSARSVPSIQRKVEIPEFFGTGSVDAGPGGDLLMVTVEDTAEAGDPNPEVRWRTNDGTGWTAAQSITTEPEMHWEMDPIVRFIGSGGQALALWTSNDGDPSLPDQPGTVLADILGGQDIDWSLYNGATWTAPAAVVDDDMADGTPALAGHPSANEAIAAWLTDPDSTPALAGPGPDETESRTDWQLRYAQYSGGSWGSLVTVPKTQSQSAVREPYLAYRPDGVALLVFSRDHDGRPETVGDAAIEASWWNGGFNQLFTLSTEPNSAGETQPSVVFLSNGDGVAAWHVRRVPTAEGSGDPVEEALFASHYDGTAESWGTPVELISSETFIDHPRLSVDDSDAVVIYYRGFDGYDGDIFSLAIDLGSLRQGKRGLNTPRQITADDTSDLAPLIPPHANDPPVLWRRLDLTGEATASDGLSGGLNVASTATTGHLDAPATFTVTTEDPDEDERIDALVLEACNVTIVAEASYWLQAEVWGVDPAEPGTPRRLLTAEGQPVVLTAGTHCLTLTVDGGLLRHAGFSGALTLAPIRLMARRTGEATLSADSDATGTMTEALTPEVFEAGPLRWNRADYAGMSHAVLSLDYADANQDSGSVESVTATVESSHAAAPMALQLTETDVDSGTFTGTILLAPQTEGTSLVVADGSVVQARFRPALGLPTFFATAVWRELARDPCALYDQDDRTDVRDLVGTINRLGSSDQDYDFDGSGTVDQTDFDVGLPCWRTQR